MSEIILTSSLLKLGFALLALFLAWLSLRGLDHLSGFNFKSTMEKIQENPIAASNYLGYRFIGVALLVGNVIS